MTHSTSKINALNKHYIAFSDLLYTKKCRKQKNSLTRGTSYDSITWTWEIYRVFKLSRYHKVHCTVTKYSVVALRLITAITMKSDTLKKLLQGHSQGNNTFKYTRKV